MTAASKVIKKVRLIW